jgi:2-polyprenyl-3-methyl-5-hydroxy-6-metoxy-1,4-benzoquinol methylase
MAVSFSKRSQAMEIMDDLTYHDEVIFQTLRELDFINQWLGGNSVTLNAIEKVWSKIPKEKIAFISDLGCGSGEMLRLIAKKALSEKRDFQLIGIDANPHVVEYAQKQSKEPVNLNFEAVNVFSDEFRARHFDIIVATLFLHHFSDDELINLLRSLKRQANTGVVVNDIHRHPLAYYSIKWLTTLFSKSSMVKFDAPLSVLRAFKRKELSAILQKSGIENYDLKWKWAFRWQLIIYC